MTTDELVRQIRERRYRAIREASAGLAAAMRKLYPFEGPIDVDEFLEPDVVVEPSQKGGAV